MKTTKFTLAAVALAAILSGCSAKASTQAANETDNMQQTEANPQVKMETSMGTVVIELFNDTPLHRDNFLRLAREGYYNGVLFHRVINEFMCQAGDPDSRTAEKGAILGESDTDYTIEAEIVYPKHFNRRGALGSARMGDDLNPERRSSGSQFYIVTGRKFTPEMITQMEQRLQLGITQDIFNRIATENRDTIMSLRANRDMVGLEEFQQKLIKQAEEEAAANPFHFHPELREAYINEGGAPHLDGAYTIYGQVVSGMEVLDMIQQVETDKNDRPVEDVKIISMEVL